MSSNLPNGAQAMVRLLRAHGVEHIFGLCGDTSLPFYDALFQEGAGITHVLTRDERSAAYMADGYARVSGRVGVCEGPSGGGATYIAPGLVEANESSVPVLAITTDIATTSRGRYALTDLDQQALFRPLTKWNSVIDSAVLLPRAVRAAFRAMTTGRPGSAHLGLPFDVQRAPVDAGEIWGDAALGRYPAWPCSPDPRSIEALFEALASARSPVIVCGGGVVISGAEAALAALARTLDIAVATTVSGQGSLAHSQPQSLGVVGSNGGVPATRAALEQADLVWFIGCRAGSVTTERWRFPRPGTRIVHLDVDPMVIGANYATEVAVCGDARLALEALLAVLGEHDGKLPAFGGAALGERTRVAKRAAFEPLAASDDSPVRPERLVRELSAALGDDAVLVADPGTPCPYVSAFYDIRTPGRSVFSNRAHGALGYSLAAAIGASYARPGAQVVSVMGDGSFGFTCGELETAVRTARPVTFVVVSNASYGWIKAGQKAGFGARYFAVDFNRTEHAAVAEAFGVRSWKVDDPRRLRAALDAALAHDGPSLVDVVCQPLHEARAPVSEWIA